MNCMYCGQYLCEYPNTAFIQCGKCSNVNIIDDDEVTNHESETQRTKTT